MIQPRNAIRWAIWLLLGWVATAVISTELIGYPYTYGWPLRIIRWSPESSSTPAWVMAVNAIAGTAVVLATALVAWWCSHRRKDRLSTLLDVVAVVAVLTVAWQPSMEFSAYVRFNMSGRSPDQISVAFPCATPGQFIGFDMNVGTGLEWGNSHTMYTSTEYDSTAAWLAQRFVGLGRMLGLACAMHAAGWLTMGYLTSSAQRADRWFAAAVRRKWGDLPTTGEAIKTFEAG
jgi:hypothetical protein